MGIRCIEVTWHNDMYWKALRHVGRLNTCDVMTWLDVLEIWKEHGGMYTGRQTLDPFPRRFEKYFTKFKCSLTERGNPVHWNAWLKPQVSRTFALTKLFMASNCWCPERNSTSGMPSKQHGAVTSLVTTNIIERAKYYEMNTLMEKVF